MRVVGFVLVCMCAFARAAVPFEINAPIGKETAVQHSLTDSEYHLTLTSKDGLFNEDDVAALYNSLSMQERSLVADRLRGLLEGFREVVTDGTDDIPVLDPLVVDQIGPFEFTTTGIRIQGNVRNFRVEGLKWFVIDHVTFQALRLTIGVQITIPWIVVQGDYDAQASIVIVNHNAGGNFRVFVNRLVVGVDLRIGTNLLGGHLLLRELDIKIDIHDTNIQFNGLFGSAVLNNILNSLVQSVTQDVIQNEMENVSALLSEQLFDTINEALSQFTLDDLLGNN